MSCPVKLFLIVREFSIDVYILFIIIIIHFMNNDPRKYPKLDTVIVCPRISCFSFSLLFFFLSTLIGCMALSLK